MVVQSRFVGRNLFSAIGLLILLFYIIYVSSELFSRLEHIKKYDRLQEYRKELDDITKMIRDYKADGRSVSKGISILKDVVSKMADSLQSEEKEMRLRKIENKILNANPNAAPPILDNQQFLRGKMLGIKYGKTPNLPNIGEITGQAVKRLSNSNEFNGRARRAPNFQFNILNNRLATDVRQKR